MLERQEVVRVGGNAPVKIDVRVIAATHRDLRHEIDAGRFREDLYFRLAQVRVLLPPLRDRTEDIPLLCQKLLASLPGEREVPVLIEQGALDFLATQPWPGNVRELRNVLARAAALAQDGLIRRQDVAGEGFGFRGTRQEREALDVSGTFARAKEQRHRALRERLPLGADEAVRGQPVAGLARGRRRAAPPARPAEEARPLRRVVGRGQGRLAAASRSIHSVARTL